MIGRCAARWKRMGFVMTLLSAIGCAPGSKAGSTTPVLSDYDVALHAGRALSIDPAVTTNGRFQIVPGSRLEVAFETPDRDLIKLGTYTLRGMFKAKSK
jgi:hypothetical protein